MKPLNEELLNKEKIIWSGNSQGGEVIEVDVNKYKKLKCKVQLSGFITFVEIDLTKITNNILKNGIYYKYGNSAIAGALDGVQYINRCSIAVSADKTKVIAYDFGYADLSRSWNFQNRDGSGNTWAILETSGIK